MPSGQAVSEHAKLEFSKDGRRLFLGTAPAPTSDPEDAPEPTKVDIWNWKDPLLQPMQKVRAEDERKRSFRAVLHLADRRFVQLATSDMPDVVLTPDGSGAVGRSDVPYRQLMSWDSDYTDAFAIDLRDGSSRRVLEKARFNPAVSPGGRWLVHYDAKQGGWMAIDLTSASAAPVPLTANLGVSFVDETWDTPEPAAAIRYRGMDGRRPFVARLRPLRHLGSVPRRLARRPDGDGGRGPQDQALVSLRPTRS